MTTEIKQPNTERNKKEGLTRIVGTISKDPEWRTTAKGNEAMSLLVAIDNGVDSHATWWNVTIMKDLASLCPDGLLEKHRYVKFIGEGSSRTWTGRDGKVRPSNDLLASGVEMQNGKLIKVDRTKKLEDEDAPF